MTVNLSVPQVSINYRPAEHPPVNADVITQASPHDFSSQNSTTVRVEHATNMSSHVWNAVVEFTLGSLLEMY